MTRKSILIVGLLLIALLPMQAARKLTKISFDKVTHDFGTLYEKDGNATCTFRFVNEGKIPLVILRAQASCGCTVPSYPEHPFTREIGTYLQSQQTFVGGKYIDLVLPDTTGTPHRLSELLRGSKIALIDFWSIHCGPCRRTSKAMIPVYEKYKDKGFCIVGISRDGRQQMIRGIRHDGYPWINLIDEYNAVGHVPFKEKDKLYKRYRELVDTLFDHFNISVSNKKLMNFRSNINTIQAEGAQPLYRERDRLVRNYESVKSELQTYENNLGFLTSTSKKGSNLMMELNRKADKLKADLELISQKIKMVDASIEELKQKQESETTAVE